MCFIEFDLTWFLSHWANRIWWGGIVQFFTKLDLVDGDIDETAIIVSQVESFESKYLMWHVLEALNVAFVSIIYGH